jgi:hypothetical protein
MRRVVSPPAHSVGATNVLERRLHAQRNALRALGHEQRFDHQQADAVLLARECRQQDAWRSRLPRKRVDRRAQRDLQLLGVQMLLENLQLAAHPGVSDRAVEQRHRVEDEALQPLPHQQIGECTLQTRGIVALQQRENVAFDRRCDLDAARRDSRVGKCVQFVERRMDDLAGTHPDVHQPLDRPELGDFRQRVLTLAVVVARRFGETVATFPHPQHVLGQPGFALDRADVENEAGMFRLHVDRPGLSPAPRSRLRGSRISLTGIPRLAYNYGPWRTSSAG